jgi:hypothetical protein
MTLGRQNSGPNRRYGRNHGGQLVDQMPTVYGFVGNVARRFIEVWSLGLRHLAFSLGEALFLELLDRLPHLAELPRRQLEFVAARLAQKIGDPLSQIAACGNDWGRHGGLGTSGARRRRSAPQRRPCAL